MRNTGKWLSLLLALALILACLPQLAVPARADELSGKCGESLEWELSVATGELRITGTGPMWDWPVGWDIPAADVPPWQSHADEIRWVTVEDGAESIGSGAFMHLKNLVRLTLPDSVKTIGDSAFFNCPELDRATIPIGVTAIGDEAFNFCSYLLDVTIPASVKSVGKAAFGNCKSGERIVKVMSRSCTLGENWLTPTDTTITTICGFPGSTAEAFAKQNGYEFKEYGETSGKCGDDLEWNLDLYTGTLYIFGSGRTWDWGEFNRSPWADFSAAVRIADLEDGVTGIGDCAFIGCQMMKQAVIPDGVSAIGDEAFCWCYDLKSVTFPDSLEHIGGGAFASCTSLKNVLIPAGVKSVGINAFYNCSALWGVIVLSRDCTIDEDKDTMNDPEATTIYGYRGSTAQAYAARNEYLFEEIADDSGKYGPDVSWEYDSANLELIVSGTGNMWENAPPPPWNKDIVRKLTIREGVANIGDYAFANCKILTDVSIPDSVTSIGAGAFQGCDRLTAISIPNRDCEIADGKNTLNDPETTRINGFRESTAEAYAREYDYRFFAFNTLSVVVDPEGAGTVSGCPTEENLESGTGITLTATPADDSWIFKWWQIQEMGSGRFLCYEPTVTFRVESDVTATAFFEKADQTSGACGYGLTWSLDEASGELTISGSGKMFGWPTGPTPWFPREKSIKTVTVEDGVINIGDYAFYCCSALTSAAVPDTVTEIGTFAFGNCGSLEDVTILNGDCVIAEGETTLGDPDVTVIHGYPGSTAEAYAAKYGYAFAPIQAPPFRFADVKNEKAFYYDAVYWAYGAKPQITNGLTDETFGPDEGCTRGQVVTFLWRAAGCPAPASTETAFTDVAEKAFYAKAVAWAVEKGITKGMSETSFAPDATCTRGQIVTFLWRFKNSPEPTLTDTGFADVNETAFYARAVAWAVEKGITKGMTPTTFSPNATCTRGQIVTFLYRAMNG